jgi:hypothetical protein
VRGQHGNLNTAGTAWKALKKEILGMILEKMLGRGLFSAFS